MRLAYPTTEGVSRAFSVMLAAECAIDDAGDTLRIPTARLSGFWPPIHVE
jgi:hypothetical protein